MPRTYETANRTMLLYIYFSITAIVLLSIHIEVTDVIINVISEHYLIFQCPTAPFSPVGVSAGSVSWAGLDLHV